MKINIYLNSESNELLLAMFCNWKLFKLGDMRWVKEGSVVHALRSHHLSRVMVSPDT